MGKTSFSKQCPLSLKQMILLVLNYCIGYLFVYPLLCIFLLQYLHVQSQTALMICVYGFTIFMSITVSLPLLKESYQIWKRDKLRILRKNMKLLLGLYIASMLASLLVSYTSQTVTSNNQISVSNSIAQFPFMMAFTTLMFAPIVEEILFRGVLYRTFRYRLNALSATIISSSAFGFLHIYDSIASGQWNDCWYFIVYALIGVFLCRSYEETETIYGPMLLHFLNNGIAFLAIIL